MEVKVCKRFTFEAAHHLPNYDGACRRRHGHGFKLFVTVKGCPGFETGMVMDFKELKKIVEDLIITPFDHSDLNLLFDNPTAENIVRYIWSVLISKLPDGVSLSRIQLYETDGSYVETDG